MLTVGTIVAVAASKAGDISQDLKTGFLVGATPARQQFGQLIGVGFACWAVAGTVMLLGGAYTFGSIDYPAPQAMLMKTIIEGVLAASGLVAGEGLAGVLVASPVGTGIAPKSLEPRLGGLAGELAALILIVALCLFLYRAARSLPAARA